MITATTSAFALAAALPGVASMPGSPATATAATRAVAGLPAPMAKATIGKVIKPGGGSVRAIAVDQKTHTVWAGVATTGKSDFIAKISETPTRVLARVAVPKGLSAIAVDPTLGAVWVISGTSLIVTEISEGSLATHSVSLAKADTGIAAITVDPATGLVFVFTVNGLIIKITEATRAVQVIALGANFEGNNGAIGVDPARGEVWTAGFTPTTQSTQLIGFTEDGTQIAGPVTLGSSPVASMVVDPVAGRVWVSDRGGNGNLEITEVGEQSASILAGPFLNFQQPVALAVDPAAGAIWVADLVARTVTRITESKGRAGIGGPVATGNFAFCVAADPGNGKVFAGGYQIGDGRNVGTVTAFTPAAPAFTSSSSAWFAAGARHAVTFLVTTSGFPAPQFAISGPAPGWLTISGRTGLLKVTPGTGVRPGKTVKIKITARNGIAAPASQSLTVHLGTAPVFTSAARVSLRAGQRAKFTIKATGVPAPALKAGKRLPGGLRFKAVGSGEAVLGGTPFRSDAGHTFKVTITATNPVGRPVTQTLTIKVT
ncbi:MAG TPA: hypothetical protein VFQ44_30090 [Streptosporangiaceae bacterium]|nr:hypothetical protein [Streptosporangiaceae bacterium]